MNKKIGLIMVTLVIVMSFSACSTRKVAATESLDPESGTALDKNEDVIVDDETGTTDNERAYDIVESGLEGHGLNILAVDVVEDTIYINVSSENLSDDSSTEMLALEQLTYYFTEFEGIEFVQLLIEGSMQDRFVGWSAVNTPPAEDDIQE